MNFDGLSAEQKRLITDLSKRIELLEAHLKMLQCNLVKIDKVLPADLARSMTDLNLN